MTSCVFTWKGTADVCHALDSSHVTGRQEGGEGGSGRCRENRAGSQACACFLAVLHSLLHRALGQSGARNREGPRRSGWAPLDMSTVCCIPARGEPAEAAWGLLESQEGSEGPGKVAMDMPGQGWASFRGERELGWVPCPQTTDIFLLWPPLSLPTDTTDITKQ